LALPGQSKSRGPNLRIEAEVRRLRPTQLTVSMVQVQLARAQIRNALARNQLQDFLTWRPLRGVVGPRAEVFVIDPHAVARALSDEGVERCIVMVEQDLSSVVVDRFWIVMERQGWVLPVDAAGRRRAFSAVPHDLFLLEDDPFRTLAAKVREVGGCDEWEGAAAEIAWAAYLRAHLSADLLAADPSQALRLALERARSAAAERLPGWKPK
jgi:hypothetical protein